MGRHARQNKMMIKAVEKIEALGLNKRGPCANEMTFFFYSQLEMDFSDVQNQESAQYNTFNSCEEKNFFFWSKWRKGGEISCLFSLAPCSFIFADQTCVQQLEKDSSLDLGSLSGRRFFFYARPRGRGQIIAPDIYRRRLSFASTLSECCICSSWVEQVEFTIARTVYQQIKVFS